MRFEASQVVFWSLSCYKELKLTTNWFTGRTLRGLLIQMQNISLRSSGMRRKQNFETRIVGHGYQHRIGDGVGSKNRSEAAQNETSCCTN